MRSRPFCKSEHFSRLCSVLSNKAFLLWLYQQQKAVQPEWRAFNNTGFGDSGSFADSEWQKQYGMVQLNVIALMQLTHCFLNTMIGQGHGKILNMSLIAAFCAGSYMSIYYATKNFARSFSKTVAEEVKGDRSDCDSVLPRVYRDGI